jgi:serine/threonine protein kinase
LRDKVEELLAAHRQAGNFIETPVADLARSSIAPDDGTDLLIGHTIGHYKISKRIGAGGMGEVYLAEDSRLSRRVALKLLPAVFTEDEDRVRRFEREARAAPCSITRTSSPFTRSAN